MPVSISSQIVNYLVQPMGYRPCLARAQEVKLNGVLKSLHPLFKTYQLPLLSPRFPEATSSPRLNPISQKDKTSDAQMRHFAVACLPMGPTASLPCDRC